MLQIIDCLARRDVGDGTDGIAGREIKFETGKLAFPAMIDRVAGVAVDLVERGCMVKDGDTLGGDERERFTVRYKTSQRFVGMPVFFCAADLAS